MRISIVTSAYHLRKSRSFDFYLQPANELLSSMAGSDLNIKVFTNVASSQFIQGDNIDICERTPDSLIEYIWEDSDWRGVYQRALKGRSSERFEEKDVPDLIGIWLGKFQMLYEAARDADVVLWQDAGIRTYLFGRQNQYVTKVIPVDRYRTMIPKLINTASVSLLTSENHNEYYHGVQMSKYGSLGNYVRAGFILATSEEIIELRDAIKMHWNTLISHGDFGTEENPLTLFSWSRSDIVCYDYKDWIRFFGLGFENWIM